MKNNLEDEDKLKSPSKPPCDDYPNYKVLLEELYNKKNSAYECLLKICESIEKSFKNKHHKLPNWEVKERIFDALTEIMMKLHKNEIYYKDIDSSNEEESEIDFDIEKINLFDETNEESKKEESTENQNKKSKKSQPTVKSLLWRISHNKIVDLVRKKVFRYNDEGVRVTKKEDQTKNDEIISKQDYIGNLEDFGQNFMSNDIFKADEISFYEELLKKLDSDERQILELRADGFTNEEIADIMNKALKTVQNTVTKIKKLIKESLKNNI